MSSNSIISNFFSSWSNFNLTSLLIWLIPLLSIVVAITIHEFSHAFAADRLGDPNPRLQKRLSLNPLRHLDIAGTFMLIFFNFGWGKPVQFDPYNLKNPRRDAAVIAAAGPISNLLTAVLCSLVLFLLATFNFAPIGIAGYILYLALYSILSISVALAIFNLIPIFPLDGSHIITAFLPAHTAYNFTKTMRKIGPVVLLLLVLPIFTSVTPVSLIVSPVVSFITNLLIPS